MERFTWTVSTAFQGSTLHDLFDAFALSGRKIAELDSQSLVLVNEETRPFSSTVKAGDVIGVDLSFFESTRFVPESGAFSILYRDAWALVVDKPAGIIVHPEGVTGTKTLANRIQAFYDEIGWPGQVRHVHRLDKDTTGVILYAPQFLAHSFLNKALEENRIEREYLAIVEGTLTAKKGFINLPIGRDRHQSGRYLVSPSGKMALTHYEVLASDGEVSLLSLKLETGRTHQLRVHMAYQGHPLVGDTLYGATIQAPRVMLHSARIRFPHPLTHDILEIRSPLPADFASTLEKRGIL